LAQLRANSRACGFEASASPDVPFRFWLPILVPQKAASRLGSGGLSLLSAKTPGRTGKETITSTDSPSRFIGETPNKTISNGSTFTACRGTQRSWKNSEGAWESVRMAPLRSFGKLRFRGNLEERRHVQVEANFVAANTRRRVRHKVFECISIDPELDRAERRGENELRVQRADQQGGVFTTR